VDVRQSVLSLNDRLAEQNRGFFRGKGLHVLNLLSGPGAGKTTLIEKTQAALGAEVPMATIVGDLETENDADRIRESGGTAVQITTGEVCHLDAHMVQHALEKLSIDGVKLLFIENVGNLVCPASFDLGEQARVVLMSVTEGEDKPLKYPVIFHNADVVLVTKTDLAEAVEFDRAKALDHVRRVAPKAKVLDVSAKKGDGMDAWLDWLRVSVSSAGVPAS
jgi:hydrogenase nickel incorporation protein HypB